MAGFNNGALVVDDPSTSRTNLQVPSTSGTGATGTWGINISGNAATATSATTSGMQVITESTTARTLQVSDSNSVILCTNNTANTTITIPLNASQSIPVGSVFTITNNTGGSFLVTFLVTVGVTILAYTSSPYSLDLGNGGFIQLQKVGTDTWQINQLHERFVTSGNTWTGPWAAAQAGEFVISRNFRNIFYDPIFAQIGTTSTVSATILSVQAVPARFRPSTSIYEFPRVQNNATIQSGSIQITSGGVIVVGATVAAAAFSAAGSAIYFRSAQLNWTI